MQAFLGNVFRRLHKYVFSLQENKETGMERVIDSVAMFK